MIGKLGDLWLATDMQLPIWPVLVNRRSVVLQYKFSAMCGAEQYTFTGQVQTPGCNSPGTSQ